MRLGSAFKTNHVKTFRRWPDDDLGTPAYTPGQQLGSTTLANKGLSAKSLSNQAIESSRRLRNLRAAGSSRNARLLPVQATVDISRNRSR
jgi:hypothetical protein